ncbi:hypothetical protein [Microcoleus sp. S13_C5]|uniref:hypothetical protein n=1 Tax=Microcoleus sp. S13_C5 TaxID=3055411 RepID=UPI002FD33F4C
MAGQKEAKKVGKKIALIWDGAKYPSSAEVKDFLSLVNNGLDQYSGQFWERYYKLTRGKDHKKVELNISQGWS